MLRRSRALSEVLEVGSALISAYVSSRWGWIGQQWVWLTVAGGLALFVGGVRLNWKRDKGLNTVMYTPAASLTPHTCSFRKV